MQEKSNMENLKISHLQILGHSQKTKTIPMTISLTFNKEAPASAFYQMSYVVLILTEKENKLFKSGVCYHENQV